MGNNKTNKIQNQNKMATQEFINDIYSIQNLIEEQNFDRALQYYNDDIVLYGPGENDLIKGHQELKAAWKAGVDVFPLLQWDEPFLDGDIAVRRGHLDTWKFECRIKVENNKVKECTTITLANEGEQRNLDNLIWNKK